MRKKTKESKAKEKNEERQEEGKKRNKLGKIKNKGGKKARVKETTYRRMNKRGCLLPRILFFQAALP